MSDDNTKFDFEVRPDFSTIKMSNNTIVTNFIHPMNPPGNPTETEAKLNELQAEVIAINDSIRSQEHIIWLAKVEIERKKKALKATLASIETITKGPEA